MGIYHQMGHNSSSLIGDLRLWRYRGAVLSPVDDKEASVSRILGRHQKPGFEFILDPQLYYPRTSRRNLPSWEYYPADVDTADLTSRAWWGQRIAAIAKVARRLRVNAVCSPAVLPRSYSADYYGLMVDVSDDLRSQLDPSGIDVLPTAVVHLRDLARAENVLETASILTRTSANRTYIIFVAEVEPRREIDQVQDIAGAMRLVRLLEGAGLKCLVGYTSSDVVLWRTAAASDCATGKFFNLRRFTPSRFDPPSQGGGQLPYWFEESLLAFIREPDILRLIGHGLISPASRDNPYYVPIVEKITGTPRGAWISESWKQYMFWFQEIEGRLRDGQVTIGSLLETAKSTWTFLDEQGALLEEPANNGRWVSRWKQAVEEFASP
jgi:hypothetical protein